MKISIPCHVLCCLLLSAATAFAVQPSSSPAPKPGASKNPGSSAMTKRAPATTDKKSGNTTQASVAAAPAAKPNPAPAPAASVATTGGVLNAYIQELAAAVSLSKDEQTDIQGYYLDDGAKLQGILNNPSLSPLQQTRQVDDLRATRNATIESLLHDANREQNFLQVEAKYRVALVVSAANGGLVPPAPPAAAPKPASPAPAT